MANSGCSCSPLLPEVGEQQGRQSERSMGHLQTEASETEGDITDGRRHYRRQHQRRREILNIRELWCLFQKSEGTLALGFWETHKVQRIISIRSDKCL